jgi:ATP-dependent Lhr-like helicase
MPEPGNNAGTVPPPGNGDPARAFERLQPGVQRWVWDHGWPSLRTVQALAVDPILARRDVLISAATAAGKTEAAWFPVVSDIASHAEDEQGGVQAVYIGPLKALINDQYLRLETLGKSADIPVHRWHGDVGASAKKAVRTKPEGILLITPESLEALFVREGPRVAAIFAGLRHIVIDEFHSFIGSERGAQLQSLMHRLDLAVRKRVPRVGLSATLADLSDAAEFLRPGNGPNVALVVSPNDVGTEIRIQVRGYVRHNPESKSGFVDPKTLADGINDQKGEETDYSDDALAIGSHLFRTLRGNDNLVFANSRSSVEAYTDILSRLSTSRRVPNEFFAHHGNLSKEHREDIESRLRSSETPATAICTSTLEMGIDIGSTDSIAQVGTPPSVAALRQRLGRSGRRGQPATLRAYISEPEVTDRTPPADMLRAHLMQTVAMTELMLNDRWYEPPNLTDLHLSTLIQQVLAVIAQHGGATALQLYDSLCGRGPFVRVSKDVFVRLLKDMGDVELLTQSSDGLLLPGLVGDRLINHYSFYSAFQSVEEYRLMARGRTLGTIPVDYPVLVGSFLIFAGLRWQVIDVDASDRIIELTRSAGGRPPTFTGNGAEVADEVRKRMRTFYESDAVPIYLDSTGQALLDEGRRNFQRLRLADRQLVDWGDDTVVLPWRGDRVLNTVSVALNSMGLRVAKDGVGLTVVGSRPAVVASAAAELVALGEPDATMLAQDVAVKVRDKYDEYLSDHLLSLAYASCSLDVAEAWKVLADLAVEHLEAPVSPTATTTSAQASVGLPHARLGETPFAVVDVETTGFAPLRNDRIVEIAIVQSDPAGVPTSHWSTLVNPLRTPGPTHIHGITEGDLANAPVWGQIAAWVADQLSGRIVVAHNAGFDLSFINLEFERADIDPPRWPTLDTLELAGYVSRSFDRSLHSCCQAAGVPLENAHTASGDAAATARLLGAHLRGAAKNAISIGHLVEDIPITATPYPRPAPPPSAPRGIARPVAPETAALISALSRAYPGDADPLTRVYLSVLDGAVLTSDPDLHIGALLAEAKRIGLGTDQARLVTSVYLRAVRDAIEGDAGQYVATLLTTTT